MNASAIDTARSPIPVWVITGPLGSGKTTVISRLLAGKPPAENWVVLLNEFSEAGIDTLTVAAAAQGTYDVRLVAGGCLCCVGEADFRRNLRELIEQSRPARILVEPSGIGHPGGIVEELLAHQSRGEVKLEAVIGLVDPERLGVLLESPATGAAAGGGLGEGSGELRENLRAAAQLADAWVLTQDDRASALDRAGFEAYAAGLFPRKAWVGTISQGRLPESLWAALAARERAPVRERSPLRVAQSGIPGKRIEHEHASHSSPAAGFRVGTGERRDVHLLGRGGASWQFPRGSLFSETRLLAALSVRPIGGDAALLPPERLKAVLQLSEDEWVLLQWVEGRVSLTPTAWRRDQRIEVQGAPGTPFAVAAWDRLWLRCQRQGDV